MSDKPEHLRELAQRTTPDAFLAKAHAVHGDRYTYPDLSDVRGRTHIRIVCAEHGEFNPTVTNHLQGGGCPACALLARNKNMSAIAKKPRPGARKTKEEWLAIFNSVHEGKYTYPDFTKAGYQPTTRDKIRAVCPIHGEFTQELGNHYRKIGCPHCVKHAQTATRPTNTRTVESFLADANKIHGSKFGYPNLSNVRSNAVINVVCPEHGEFTQQVEDHLRGGGCRMCSNTANGRTQLNTAEDVLARFRSAWGEWAERYSYPDLSDVRGATRIPVVCKRHGDFTTVVAEHMRGKSGCPKCVLGVEYTLVPRHVKGEPRGPRTVGKMNADMFDVRAHEIHGDCYTYDMSTFVNMRTPMRMKCAMHGEFMQAPDSHIYQRSGCPSCKRSKGERLVASLFMDAGIDFIPQHRFVECVGEGGKTLPFDFYVPSKQICVEYDGAHHVQPLDYSHRHGRMEQKHTPTALHARQLEHDRIKTDYCEASGIKLVRVNCYMTVDQMKLVLDI